MVILNPGSIFEYNTASPSTTVSGSKLIGAHCYKFCPYSTQIIVFSGDSQIPTAQKTFHGETSGFMHSYSLGGPMGWVCADNSCSFFLGTATSGIIQNGVSFVPTSGTTACPGDLPTLSGSVQPINIERKIVPTIRQRYFEI